MPSPFSFADAADCRPADGTDWAGTFVLSSWDLLPIAGLAGFPDTLTSSRLEGDPAGRNLRAESGGGRGDSKVVTSSHMQS